MCLGATDWEIHSDKAATSALWEGLGARSPTTSYCKTLRKCELISSPSRPVGEMGWIELYNPYESGSTIQRG